MFNWRFTKDYVLHVVTAKNKHGIHSPFVYKLAEQVLHQFKNNEDYLKVEQARKKLFKDSRIITVTDLGAGSVVNNNRKRKVSNIAKNAIKPPKLGQLLYRLAAALQPDNMIELGTCLGITSLYLKYGAPGATLYTLEGCAEIAGIAQETFTTNGQHQIRLVKGNFDDTLPALLNNLTTADFVFIDGNHQKEATLNYFNWLLEKVNENTLLIFDDIYWSAGMKAAWNEIKSNPKVTVTIDLFWVGLVFFKSDQAKQHFRIKV
jgi:predicted O-methyltransferase YrrM